MAAPVVVSKGTASAATTATVTPSYPASVVADDVVFLLAISHQPNGIGVINTPSGFAEVAQDTYANSGAVNQGRVALFWRRATGSLSGTVSVTRTGDTGTDGTFYAQMYRVTGCITSGDPWDAVASKFDGNGSTTVTFAAVTVSGSERTLAAFCAQADNASTVDPPTSYTGLVTDTTATGTDAELRLSHYANQSSGPSVTATGGETEGWATFHVALKPPAVDPTGTVAVTLGAATSSASGAVGAAGTAAVTLASVEAPPSSAVGGFDANADKLTNQTNLPADLISPYTVTGWFKRTSNAAEGVPFSMHNGSSFNQPRITTAGTLSIRSNLGGTDLGSVTLDTWYFIAMTQSGATRTLTAYYGERGGSLTSGTHTSINDATATTDFYLGGGVYFGTAIAGSLAEVRLWTRELTQAQVEAEFASYRTPASTTDLVGHYPLIDSASKLDALVGSDLATTGSGSWSTDSSGPFPAGFGAGTVEAPPSSVTGTGAPSLGAATSAASGSTVTGSAGPSLGAATSEGAGARGAAGTSATTIGTATSAASGSTVTGSASPTLTAATGSATGAHGVAGTSARALADATSTASGARGAAGTSSRTIDAATSSATGASGAAGAVASSLGVATSTATGTHTAPNIEGTAAVTLGAATSTANGSTVTGTSATTLSTATGAATGARGAAGTSASALGASTGAASGSSVAGTSAPALGAATSNATGTASGATIEGTATPSLVAATSSATGARGAAGTASPSLGAATAAGVGSFGTDVTGIGSPTLGAATASASGERGATGAAAPALAAAGAVATGEVGANGSLSVALGAAVSVGTGTSTPPQVTGTASIALAASAAAALGTLGVSGSAASDLHAAVADAAGVHVAGALGFAAVTLDGATVSRGRGVAASDHGNGGGGLRPVRSSVSVG